MKPCIFFHLQQTLQTLIAVVKPTLNSRAQPVATEQAVPPKFNTPLVAGMYVCKHTHHVQTYSITNARLLGAVQLTRPCTQAMFSCILLAATIYLFQDE